MGESATRHLQEQQRKSSDLTRRRTPALSGVESPVHVVQRLQRSMGNQAVLRFMRSQRDEKGRDPAGSPGHDLERTALLSKMSSTIQPKLAVSRPGDQYEQEADRIAQRVMHAPESPHSGSENVKSGSAQIMRNPVQAKSAQTIQSGETGAPSIVQRVLNSPGQPLDTTTRAFMEPRFGHDFSKVRVHTDSRAAASAKSLNAQAYTVGHDVVFGAGQFSSGTQQGRQTIAHELVHTLQQRNHTNRMDGSDVSITPAEPQLQRKLVLTGDKKNLVRVKNIMDQGLSPLFAAKVNGAVEIVNSGKKGTMTPQNKTFLDKLKLITSESKTTTVDVVSGGKAVIGDYFLSQIDIADIEKLGIGELGADARASLLHELIEQREKQHAATKPERDYGTETTGAHGKGRAAELELVGAKFVLQLPRVGYVTHSDGTESFTQTLIYKYPDGASSEIELTVKHGDITVNRKPKKKQ